MEEGMLIVRVDDDGISRLTAQLTERLMVLGDAEAGRRLGRSLRDFLQPDELAKMFEVQPGNQPGTVLVRPSPAMYQLLADLA